jgi:hypothetical protein
VPGCRISDTHLPHFRFRTPLVLLLNRVTAARDRR